MDQQSPSAKVKLLDFWAPWCGPCKMMHPVLEELKTEFASEVDIQEINVDEDPVTSQKYGVMSIPTYIILKGNEEVGRRVGVTSKQELISLLKS